MGGGEHIPSEAGYPGPQHAVRSVQNEHFHAVVDMGR